MCTGGLKEGSSYPSVLSIAALRFLSGWRWSHWMRIRSQWDRETTHSFQIMREQKKLYLEKRTSWRRHHQSLSERSTLQASTCDTGFLLQRRLVV